MEQFLARESPPTRLIVKSLQQSRKRGSAGGSILRRGSGQAALTTGRGLTWAITRAVGLALLVTYFLTRKEDAPAPEAGPEEEAQVPGD